MLRSCGHGDRKKRNGTSVYMAHVVWAKHADGLARLHYVTQVFPFPGKDETYAVPFTRVVYIEQDDFREQDQKKYFGLAPGKSVLLRCDLCCCQRCEYVQHHVTSSAAMSISYRQEFCLW